MFRSLKLAMLAATIALGLASPAKAADKLTVMLDWFINPESRRRIHCAGRSQRSAQAGRRWPR
jgi:hypothetical protein